MIFFIKFSCISVDWTEKKVLLVSTVCFIVGIKVWKFIPKELLIFFNQYLPIEEKKPPIDLCFSSERSERVAKYIHAPNRIAKFGSSA